MAERIDQFRQGMDDEQLRSKNRALIRRLIDGQKAVQRHCYDSSKLGRHLESVQQKLDRMSLGQPSVVSPCKSNSSPRINLNNNNCTNERQQILKEPVGYISTSPTSTLDTSISPGLDRLAVLTSTVDDSKTVRRKLADEMKSPRQQCRMDGSTKHKTSRSVLKNCSNVHGTPDKLCPSSQATPKSILKHRRMIDNNIQVQSKFEHTPGWMERAKHTRLRSHHSRMKPPAEQSREKRKANSRKVPSIANSSHLSDLADWSSSMDTLPNADPPADADLKSEAGNMRSHTRTRAANDSAALSQGQPTPNRDTMPTPSSLSQIGPSPSTPTQSVVKQRMMGYDWIAALLDQSEETEVKDKHESYFRELREFRRIHRDECENDATALPSGDAGALLVDTTNISPPKPDAVSPSHTCIHSYTVNPRLYAVPMNSDKTGESRCAVCNKRKQLPSATSPSFVRVSIPRSTLSSPYKVRPHRRKSFDPSDSVALSKHCLAGWVHQRPLKLPAGRNVDLANETNRLKSKFFMTMAEAEDLARKSKASHSVTSRDIDQTTLYSREVKKLTNHLLDLSHSMQFQTQLLNKTPVH